MADAWTVLYNNSPLGPGFDAWEHLLAQEGGGGIPDTLVLVDGLGVGLDNASLLSVLRTDKITVGIDKVSYDINIMKESPIETLVDNNQINVNVLSDRLAVEIGGSSILIPEGDIMRKTCAEDVGGHRMVTVDDIGHILHADSDLIIDGKSVVGMTLQAALAGSDCEIAISGDEVIEPSWNWDTSLPIYCGDNGVLTQNVPTIGFVLIVAVVLSPTSVRVRIEMPIFL